MNNIYEEECAMLRDHLQAKSVFILALDPVGAEGKLVLGGTMTVETGVRLLDCLRALTDRLETDLGCLFAQTTPMQHVGKHNLN